jgi:O-antigen/teichoic acid export membrane protein
MNKWSLHKRTVFDQRFTRLIKDGGVLLGGNTAATILGLGTLAVTARALTPAEFGLLVLIQSYVVIVDRLFNFQTWQAVIKYGADALRIGNGSIKKVINLGVRIDVATALLAFAIAYLSAGTVGGWFGWNDEIILMTRVYCLTIAFNIAGTPTGILRLFDKFKLLSLQKILAEAFRLVGALVALFAGLGLEGFVLVWMGTAILGYVLLAAFAFVELRDHRLLGFPKESLRSLDSLFPGIWGFLVTTNLNSGIRLASREGDMLLVGGLLGPAAAGLYKVAKQISSLLARVSDPFYQAIYPELARLWSASRIREFVSLAVKSSAAAGIMALIGWSGFLLIGEWIIGHFLAPEYTAAFAVTSVYMLAYVIAVAGFPLHPAMLAMGKPHLTFWVHTLATLAYVPALYALVSMYGLVGAGLAYVLFYVVWTGAMLCIQAFTIQTRLRSDAMEHAAAQ